MKIFKEILNHVFLSDLVKLVVQWEDLSLVCLDQKQVLQKVSKFYLKISSNKRIYRSIVL